MFDTDTCDYETWKNDLPSLYTCDQEKEVPILNIMGAFDNFVIKEGINLEEEWFGNAPFEYGPRFMREKYNCNPDDLHVTYRKAEEGDPTDFTECKT